MLAAVELHGVVQRERRPRGVGAGDVLGPAGALDEVHPRRPAAQPGVALDPQHPAGGVGDRDDHAVVLGVLDQQAADHRQHRRQRVRRRGSASRSSSSRSTGGAAPSGSIPLPRLRRQDSQTTLRTCCGGRRDGRHHRLVGGAQPAGERGVGPPLGQREPRRGGHGLGPGLWLMSRPSSPVGTRSAPERAAPGQSRRWARRQQRPGAARPQGARPQSRAVGEVLRAAGGDEGRRPHHGPVRPPAGQPVGERRRRPAAPAPGGTAARRLPPPASGAGWPRGRACARRSPSRAARARPASPTGGRPSGGRQPAGQPHRRAGEDAGRRRAGPAAARPAASASAAADHGETTTGATAAPCRRASSAAPVP